MAAHSSILAIIPARGGSKRLPRKNVLPFAGKPLIAWSIEQARASGVVDRVVVSTDNDEITGVAAQWGAEVMRRPAALATDTATTYDVLIHVLDTLADEEYVPDAVVLLQPTSPLRTALDITESIARWRVRPEGMVVSVCPLDHPAAAWSFRADREEIVPILGWDVLTKRSQDVPALYIPNGAVYVFAPQPLRARGRVYGPPLFPYVMPSERSADIDTQEDFDRALRIAQQYA